MERSHMPPSRTKAAAGWLAIAGVASCLVIFVLLALLSLLPGATLLERLRWLDSGICAQVIGHTFEAGGMLLPLCARNTGIYLGYLVTLGGVVLTGRGNARHMPSRAFTIAMACGLLLCGIDGGNSLLLDLGLPHLYQPQNVLRLVSGLAAGTAAAAFLLPQQNRLLWCGYNEQASLAGWRTLRWLLPALVVCTLATLAQSELLLYPLALLSTAGLVMALGNVNLILIVAISKRDETFVSYRELIPFYGLAVLCALGELALLAQAKQLLLQTLSIYL